MKITKDQVRKSREKFGDAWAKGMSERCIDYKSRYEAVCAELEELQREYQFLQESHDCIEELNQDKARLYVELSGSIPKIKADAVREAIEHLKADQLGRYGIVLPDVKEAIETLEAYAGRLEGDISDMAFDEHADKLEQGE